jgi:uncharacterized protein YndB with AHSA1/START domain
MSHIHVKAERIIDVKPEVVHETLTDYRWKRPQILTSNFLDYTVGKGGKGAGTEVHYRLRAARRERPYVMQIEEPIKGLAITEQDRNSSLLTTWTLTPIGNGERTKVRVDSEWEGGTGVGGFFERTFAPLGLQNIYSKILSNLAGLLQPSSNALEEGPPSRPALPFLIGGTVIATAGIAVVLILRNQQKYAK